MRLACGAATSSRSTHWYENEFGPVAPGSKRVGPGLLTNVCSPTFVLRMRNRAGAPDTSALTLTVIGKMAVGSASNPGTASHVVDDVETVEDRQTVSMQSTGVRPVVVPAITPRAPTTTRPSASIATSRFLRIEASFHARSRPAPRTMEGTGPPRKRWASGSLRGLGGSLQSGDVEL